jgi:hypothetical protein
MAHGRLRPNLPRGITEATVFDALQTLFGEP